VRQTSRPSGAAHHDLPAKCGTDAHICDDIDVVELLPKVQVPTLVLRCRHDNAAAFAQGRRIAARFRAPNS